MRTFSKHLGPITGVALIPDSSYAVTSGYDSAVALFDLENQSVKLLGYHDHLVNSVQVDATGKWAATCSSDYTVRIWDLETLKIALVLEGHQDDVEAFVFINNRLGASASRDRTIRVWDLETGAIVMTLEGHEKDVLALAVHDDALYSSGDDMTLRRWNLTRGQLTDTWGPFDHEADTCALDPIRRRAILGCDDGRIRVFGIDDGVLKAEIDAHASGIKKVSVSPVTGDLLSAAYDQNIHIWDAATLERKLSLTRAPSTWERSLTWSLDGRYIIAGTFNGTVLRWSATDGQLLSETGGDPVTPGNACLNDIAVGAGGEFASVSDDGLIRIGQLGPEGAEWLSVTVPATGAVLMNAVAFDPQARLVVGGSHDHKLHVYQYETPHLRNEIEVHVSEGPINSIRISTQERDADIFAACYSGRIMRIGRDGRTINTIEVHDGAVKALRLHPTKAIGLSCGADGQIHSWYYDGTPHRKFAGHSAIANDIDIAPDGELMASVGRDFNLKVWRIETGELLYSHSIGKRSLKSVCFFNPSLVLIGDYWGRIYAVDIRSGEIRSRDIAHNGLSALGRNGDHIVAISYEGAAFLVDPNSLNVVNTLRAMQQRPDRIVAREASGMDSSATRTFTTKTTEPIAHCDHSSSPIVSSVSAPTPMPTRYGPFIIQLYEEHATGKEHVMIRFGKGRPGQLPLVRLHSECFTGDVIGSLRCDCGQQLDLALKQIADSGFGCVLYLRQEGRNIGLRKKLEAYGLQDEGYDTVEANLQLGLPADGRNYRAAAQMLKDQGLTVLRLLTNNPGKIQGLEDEGIEVREHLSLIVRAVAESENYLYTKQKKMGHMLKMASPSVTL